MDKEDARRQLKEALEKKESLEMERQLKEVNRQNKEMERELHPTGFQKALKVVKAVDRGMVKFSAKNIEATKKLGSDLMKSNTISEKDFPMNPNKRARRLIYG